MDTLFKIGIVGCPGLSAALLKVAPRLMPRVYQSWDIEYFSIIPHDAADAVGKLRQEAVNIILLGYPQPTVSAWEISELLMEDRGRPPIVLIRLRQVSRGDTEGKPDGIKDFEQGELDRICEEIQTHALSRTAKPEPPVAKRR